MVEEDDTSMDYIISKLHKHDAKVDEENSLAVAVEELSRLLLR